MSVQSIKSIHYGVMIDAGTEETIIRMESGVVVQVSPDFNCVNVWAPGAFDEDPRPYCVDGKFVSMPYGPPP